MRLSRLLRDRRALSGVAADGIAGAIAQALDELLQAMVWCDRAGVYVPTEDQVRAVVRPRQG